jgi:hypothetical protein
MRDLEIARRERGKSLEELDLDRRRVHIAHGVREERRLARDRLQHARVGMSHGRDTEGRGQVEVRVTVRVPDAGPGRPFPDDGEAPADGGQPRVLDPGEAGEESARASALAAGATATSVRTSGPRPGPPIAADPIAGGR